MNRRFVKTPPAWATGPVWTRAEAAAAAVGVALIVAIILAIFCAGCGGSFGPANPTSPPDAVEEDVTLPTGPGLGMFQFEVGLPAGDPLQAWDRVAERLDFDPAVGLMFSSYLEYLPSGVIRHFSAQATTGDDREVLVNWPGEPGGGKIASIESAPPGFMGPDQPTAYTVHSALGALAAVGHDNILAKLPAPGETGYYSLQLVVDHMAHGLSYQFVVITDQDPDRRLSPALNVGSTQCCAAPYLSPCGNHVKTQGPTQTSHIRSTAR